MSTVHALGPAPLVLLHDSCLEMLVGVVVSCERPVGALPPQPVLQWQFFTGGVVGYTIRSARAGGHWGLSMEGGRGAGQ